MGGVIFALFILYHGFHSSTNHIQNIPPHRAKTATRELKRVPAYTKSNTRGQAPQMIDLGLYEATGYTHTGHMTKTEIWPYRGIVAVDPSVIPLHTKLYIEGYGYAVTEDTGGAIKGNKLDLFFETYGEAKNWGRKKVRVWIVER